MPEHDDIPALESVDAVTPEDPEWDDARSAWNLSIDQQPALVARPRSAEDIVSIVEYAAANGFCVTAQTTGHQAGLVDLSQTILVKTQHLRDIRVDSEAATMHVGAGVLWGQAVNAAAEHGLACLSGTAGSVGVTGYTLGGGLSWFSREHGLAASSVVSIQVITADAQLRRVDARNDPELFWALRGGGGDLGIVAAWEMRLLPITQVYAGAMFWPIEHAREVMTTWSRWAITLSDRTSTCGRLLTFPPLPEVDEDLRGKSFVGVEIVHNGTPAEGGSLVDPFRRLSPVRDNVGVIDVAEILAVHGDPPSPAAGHGDGFCLDALPDPAIDSLIEQFQSSSALVSVEFRRLGGALGRQAPDGGALSRLPGEFAGYCVGPVTPVADVDTIQGDISSLKAALAPWISALGFANFSHTPSDLGAFTDESVHARLITIKQQYDPDGVIRGCHPVSLR